ncbi:Flp pilus assembly protein TadG [Acetoanaerobium pronyense]|uniref:Flp pilus assembly protein TadG n=1 Tax=Acetoanaerobium pronyense TaxID=1482736 RepID=A0ABS4KKJ8_9FIRM|nr:TadE/TadG family type IV pilus assembly protein [Acetoanaerobium pronyense]MBP2028303.1 Flp pilus assembly protein TadG [Acetoanaerobium pronyense]
MKGIFGPIKNSKGQSLVETALVLPLVILIVFGTIEFGRVFNAYLIVSNASREGARAAAVGKSNAEINTLVTDKASTLGAVTVTINPSGSRTYGNEVTVTVNHNLNLIVPIIRTIIAPGGILNVNSATSMRVESE